MSDINMLHLYSSTKLSRSDTSHLSNDSALYMSVFLHQFHGLCCYWHKGKTCSSLSLSVQTDVGRICGWNTVEWNPMFFRPILWVTWYGQMRGKHGIVLQDDSMFPSIISHAHNNYGYILCSINIQQCLTDNYPKMHQGKHRNPNIVINLAVDIRILYIKLKWH
jgi:hypothetical protein